MSSTCFEALVLLVALLDITGTVLVQEVDAETLETIVFMVHINKTM